MIYKLTIIKKDINEVTITDNYENACKLLGKAMIEFPGKYNLKGRKITDKDRKYLGWSK